MLVQVPKGKKFFVGRFRFIEGEVIPPHLSINLKDVSFPDELVEDLDFPLPEPVEDEKPKRKYVRKPKAEDIPEADE